MPGVSFEDERAAGRATGQEQQLCDACCRGAAEERERLAREIHDTLAQGFASIIVLAEAAHSGIATDPATSGRQLLSIEHTARENLAEARVRSTNTVDPQALALLNAVRGRSNGGIYTAASFASSGAMADAILLERRIEFLGEGLRNTDLLRLLQPIPGKSSVSAVTPDAALYIWPIPNTELANNSLMVRN